MSGSITPWVPQVHPVRNGEDVKDVVTNRFPFELMQRTQYLKDLLDALGVGKALIDRGAPIASDVSVGHAVYWDASTLQYKRAIARVVYDPAVGGFITAPSSYVAGICRFKSSPTVGDVTLLGLDGTINFSAAIGSPGNTPAEAGAYYLSASEAGKYSKTQPAVGIFVCFLHGDGWAQVYPTPKELLEQHVHYVVDLVAEPAGELECPEPGLPYSFVSEDPNKQGWLTAGHPIFGVPSVAPVGAVFGYNISQHPELNRLWPPFPAETAYIEMDGLGVSRQVCRADSHGLWWFENCYGKAPWPTEPRPCGGVVPEPSSSSSLMCDIGPTLEQMGFVRTDPLKKRMRIYFTKMPAKSNAAVVTSLTSPSGSPIQIVGCDGQPATRGDLTVLLNLGSNVVDDPLDYHALKNVTGLQFTRGLVATGLRPGYGISITPVTGRGVFEDNAYRGEMTISAANLSLLGREGSMELVALNGAREESDSDVFFLSFPQGLQTSMRVRVGLPRTGLPTPNPMMKLWFWLLARAGGQALPPLQWSYRRIATPDWQFNPCSNPGKLSNSSESTLASLSVCPSTIMQTGWYIYGETPPFAVLDGDVVFATLLRPVDLYPGDVGVLRMGFSVDPT